MSVYYGIYCLGALDIYIHISTALVLSLLMLTHVFDLSFHSVSIMNWLDHRLIFSSSVTHSYIIHSSFELMLYTPTEVDSL